MSLAEVEVILGCPAGDYHDPDHPVVTIDVSAMTKMTLSGAVQGWLAGKLQSLLATQTDQPCDEGTFGADDKKC